MKVFSGTYHEDWKEIVERFGLFGGKRRYNVATYFSNRLDTYSQKPHSILVQFKGYKEGKFTDYRKTADEERKVFGSPWIAVHKRRREQALSWRRFLSVLMPFKVRGLILQQVLTEGKLQLVARQKMRR